MILNIFIPAHIIIGFFILRVIWVNHLLTNWPWGIWLLNNWHSWEVFDGALGRKILVDEILIIAYKPIFVFFKFVKLSNSFLPVD